MADNHLNLRVGQYALIRNNQGKILALRRSKSGLWSLPGGRLNSDERDWFGALKREVTEETGLEITSAKPISVEIVDDPYQVKYCVYFAVICSDTNNINLTDEHSEYRFADPGEVEFEYPHIEETIKEYLNYK
ncbi:MAG: NUDIX domain-containing protein [Candidatus Berkelbacteria bacterium]|nr:NUDIX domain-containing protein [Candidatus Berkelbacteria bacterium]